MRHPRSCLFCFHRPGPALCRRLSSDLSLTAGRNRPGTAVKASLCQESTKILNPWANKLSSSHVLLISLTLCISFVVLFVVFLQYFLTRSSQDGESILSAQSLLHNAFFSQKSPLRLLLSQSSSVIVAKISVSCRRCVMVSTRSSRRFGALYINHCRSEIGPSKSNQTILKSAGVSAGGILPRSAHLLILYSGCWFRWRRNVENVEPWTMDHKTTASKISVFQAECLWSLALSS